MTEVKQYQLTFAEVVCDDFKSRIVMISFHFAVIWQITGTGTLKVYNVKHNFDS